MAGSAVELITLPLFAKLSDRIGRRPVYADHRHGGVGVRLFRLLDTGDPAMVFVAIIVALVLHGVMYGPQAAFIAGSSSRTRVRYSGCFHILSGHLGFRLPGADHCYGPAEADRLGPAHRHLCRYHAAP